MSKAFTPGPWYVETTTASDGECNIVFPQNGNAALSSQYVSREDAHLISAAPDMYEALKRAELAIYKIQAQVADTGEYDERAALDLYQAGEMLAAALAKADGAQ